MNDVVHNWPSEMQSMQAGAASHQSNCEELVAKIVAAQDIAHDAKARAALLESQKSAAEVQVESSRRRVSPCSCLKQTTFRI